MLALYCLAIGFAAFFPLPLFVRRFGKFMPADAGTALVRSFHLPKLADAKDEKRRQIRKKLWLKLLYSCFEWGLGGGVLLWGLMFVGYSPVLFIFLTMAALLAGIDERYRLLPDVLTVPALIFGFCAAAANVGVVPVPASAAGALFGFVLPTVAGALMTPFKPRAMGGGDFKMLAATGAWIGFLGVAVAILASFFFFTVIVLSRRSKEGPYGLALFLGVIAYLVLQTLPAFRDLFVVV